MPHCPDESSCDTAFSPYSLDLVRCRRAPVDCQVKGEFDSMEQLAQAVSVSPDISIGQRAT